jgi:TusE/DsrC/DsvC family sulfur relay protein
MFPVPVIGSFSLLQESRINHLGKVAFRWMYWNLLIRGRRIPISALMSMAGKAIEVNEEGFLTEYDQWDEEIALELARNIDIPMTEERWKIIRFLRADFKSQGETATSRRVQTVGGVPVKEQFALFPKNQERR